MWGLLGPQSLYLCPPSMSSPSPTALATTPSPSTPLCVFLFQAMCLTFRWNICHVHFCVLHLQQNFPKWNSSLLHSLPVSCPKLRPFLTPLGSQDKISVLDSYCAICKLIPLCEKGYEMSFQNRPCIHRDIALLKAFISSPGLLK